MKRVPLTQVSPTTVGCEGTWYQDPTGDIKSNSQQLTVWRKTFSWGGLRDLIKIWIVFGRLPYNVGRSRSPKKVLGYRRRKRLTNKSFAKLMSNPHTLQVFHKLTAQDRSLRQIYVHIMEDDKFFGSTVFTYEAKFHIYGHVNRLNYVIWGG
jgi:hypothetical protein